jgi:hypothetical protein
MSEAVKTKTLQARVMGQPTGTALTLDDQLRGQTLSSVLARLAGPEGRAPRPAQQLRGVVGGDSRLVDPRRTTLAEIAAMFDADQIQVDLNVNARGGSDELEPPPRPPAAASDVEPTPREAHAPSAHPRPLHAPRDTPPAPYSRAVDALVGDLEVAFLLLGRPKRSRQVSEVFLVRGLGGRLRELLRER